MRTEKKLSTIDAALADLGKAGIFGWYPLAATRKAACRRVLLKHFGLLIRLQAKAEKEGAVVRECASRGILK